MQERRTAIRVRHWARAQYCASSDLIPRDGRVTDVSERGAGLWTREPHARDERVTMTFMLPGDDEPLTATGVARWARERAVRQWWYPLGVEWLPLEETMRYRLRSFLKHRTESAAHQVPAPEGAGSTLGWMARTVWLPVGGLCVVLAALIGTVQVRREHRRLARTLQQQDALIQTLEGQRMALQHELGVTQDQSAATIEELVRLDQQISQFRLVLQRAEEETTAYRGSYALITKEREALQGRIQRLQQEREVLAAQFRLAIRALMASQRGTTEATKTPSPDRQDSAGPGNHGYLIKDGNPTRGTAWIRVYEPEMAPGSSRQPRS